MKKTVISLENKKVAEIELNDAIYSLTPREDILHRMVNWQLAKRRAGTHKVKNRAEIARTSKRIARQKGTGNARHGSARVNIFRGGGRAFGPTPRSHAFSLTKKFRALALKMALSSKEKAGQLTIVDDLKAVNAKTKDLRVKFVALGIENGLFIGGGELDSNFALAAKKYS